MLRKNLLNTAVLILVCLNTVLPQSGEDAAKRKRDLEEKALQMLEQTVGEANSLKLPQNKAVVYGILGDLFWRFDIKKSRELFRLTGTEINNYYLDVEKERRENEDKPADAFDPMDVRAEVLNVVAIRDPELALEILVQTRPTAVSEAMARMNQPTVDPIGKTVPSDARAQQEIQMEERFTLRAASFDPERAAAAVKASLAKGISSGILPLLYTVYNSDPKKANYLAGTAVSKIAETDLTKNISDLNGAILLLGTVNRPAPKTPMPIGGFVFSESQLKEIANKLSNTFLSSPPSPAITSALSRALPTLEKVVPERALLLKQRDQANKKAQTAQNGKRPAAQPAFDPNASLEEILAQASKMANQRDKTAAYQNVVSRLNQVTDDARAKRLIEQIGDERLRKSASEQFEAARASRLIAAGKFEEALKSISLLPNRHVRAQRLVALALQYAVKKTEADLETAGALMNEAKALSTADPQDEDDISTLMELVRGFAVLDPAAAFRLIEPVIGQFDEITQASAVLSRYNKRDRAFKNGEMLMRVNGTPGGPLPFRYTPHYQQLGKADIEKMGALADRFTRLDARIMIRLFALQGYVRANPIPPPR
jgi:hypothetical protein